MPLKSIIAQELPYLRRYARAIMGSQPLGDATVREVLETLIEAPGEFNRNAPPRRELFRVFHRIWSERSVTPLAARGGSVIADLPVLARETLMLTAVERFSITDVAHIMECSVADVESRLAEARQAIARSLSARVMIIEDESIIAMHLKSIVRSIGHDVISEVRTHSEAVRAAHEVHPELILADISLADGSSGIDAVREILQEMTVPVIFITAFPERLLTGERPEPAYLITKPFEPETVTATIWQALIVAREQGNVVPTGA